MKERGNLTTDNKKLANLFNTYFVNVTDALQLKQSPLRFPSLAEIISFYENHDSIFKSKENNIILKEFCFKEVSSNEIKKVVKSLNRKKLAMSSYIPVSILMTQ